MTIQQITPLEDGTYLASTKDGKLNLWSTVYKPKGYWVSDDSGVTIEGYLTREGIKDALDLMEVQPYENIGVWTDTETNITYIDRSYHFYRKETAIDFGNLYNQIAIWDCANKEEIRL